MFPLAHVDLDRATVLVHRAEKRIWAHNLRARHLHPTVITTECRGRRHPTRMRCFVRAWSSQRQILELRLSVTAIRVRNAHTQTFEDGSGFVRYSAHRTLVLDPDCQPSAPCIDG